MPGTWTFSRFVIEPRVKNYTGSEMKQWSGETRLTQNFFVISDLLLNTAADLYNFETSNECHHAIIAFLVMLNWNLCTKN